MPAKWHRRIGLTAAILPLLLLTRADLNAANPSAVPPGSHSAPAADVSETASFSPPSMAAFLDRPVPQGNVSGTTSGDRPLAVTLEAPVALGQPVMPRTLTPVAFQAAAPPMVPLAPAPRQRLPMEVAPMPRTVEPPIGPSPTRTVPVPAMPTSAQPMPVGTPMPGMPPGAPMTVLPGTLGQPLPQTTTVIPGTPGMPVVDHDIWYSEGEFGGCADGCCGDTGDCCGWRPMQRLFHGDCVGGPGCEAPFNHTFYASVEYLLWYLRGSDYPTLVQQSIPGLAPQTLLGGTSVNRDEFSGARFRAGLWCDEQHLLGLEGSYVGLGDATNQMNVQSAGMPMLSIPFTDGMNVTALPLATGALSGSVQATMRTQFYGADVNLRRNLWLGPNWHIDGLLGVRYAGLRDDFSFATQRTLGPLAIATNDVIRTRNHFYGGQIGAVAEWDYGPWSLGVRSTSALGYSYQSTDTSGTTRSNIGINNSAGLLTSGINRMDSRSRSAFVQEVGFTLGYQLTDSFRLTTGYNLLYWSNVVRPGEQIDMVRNVPGRPAFNRQSADFWAQGLTVGLEFRY